jgi:hypothetical protein
MVEPPAGFEHVFGPPQEYAELDDIMDLRRRKDNPEYQLYIEGILNHLVNTKGYKFGGLVMEPVILGAGGMFFVYVHASLSPMPTNKSPIGTPSSNVNSSPQSALTHQ